MYLAEFSGRAPAQERASRPAGRKALVGNPGPWLDPRAWKVILKLCCLKDGDRFWQGDDDRDEIEQRVQGLMAVLGVEPIVR